VVGEFDLDCAVLEEFGGSFASLIASEPTKVDRVAGEFDLEASLQSAEGDFSALRGDRQRRRAAQIEVSAIPEVGLDDPPAADQAAVGWAFTPRLP
jgi:hypothetical protein